MSLLLNDDHFYARQLGKHLKYDHASNDLLQATSNAINRVDQENWHLKHVDRLCYTLNTSFRVPLQPLLNHGYQMAVRAPPYLNCRVLIFQRFFRFGLRANATEFLAVVYVLHLTVAPR